MPHGRVPTQAFNFLQLLMNGIPVLMMAQLMVVTRVLNTYF
jgi:hypothetical protein